MYEEWNELKVVESGEINGVRIPKGVTITVNIEDARRLIETKKAVFAESLSDETDEVSPPIAAPEQNASEQNASEQNASEQNASEQNTADQSEPAAKMEMPSLEKDENPATLDNVDTPNEAVADSTSNLGEPVLASNSDIEQAMAELAEGEELDLTATPQSDKDNH
jgi:hypothetical protein